MLTLLSQTKGRRFSLSAIYSCRFFGIAVVGLLSVAESLKANPSGGNVATGAATIQGGSGTLTVHQTSSQAIINWQAFSIGNGEITQFKQPNSHSAVLNRVLGGATSQINGSLLANGQVYLVNQNGIIIGPGGMVNAVGGFTGSTRDIGDSNFLSRNHSFYGRGKGGVTNLGQVTSLLGNVVLIGNSVENEGKINAQKGTVGLVAGNDVLLGQKNADGSTITVNPTPLARGSRTGVTNSGTILATAAELKASSGNIYAMAVNNGGAIQATTVAHQGGHIWLSSTGGQVVNTGKLNASSSAPGGTGGSIVLKSTSGSVADSGAIVATGGTDGTGGYVDVSAPEVSYTGSINLTAPNGVTGQFILDPTSLQVVSGGMGSISNGMNGSGSTIDPALVDAALESSDVTLNADQSITISNGLNWSNGNTLTLSTNSGGASSLTIDASISASSGGLTIAMAGNDPVTTTNNGSIAVSRFILQSGSWSQVVGANGLTSLPSFSATGDFELQNGSSFLRASGGSGVQGNPYNIDDVYGLQGIGSPSGNYLYTDFILVSNIDGSVTSNWYSGRGFSPIGSAGTPFEGIFRGEGFVIQNLVSNRPGQNDIGLFGDGGVNSTVEHVGISGGTFVGDQYVGALEGQNDGGIVTNCFESADVRTASGGAGLVGPTGYDPRVHSAGYISAYQNADNSAFTNKYATAKYRAKSSLHNAQRTAQRHAIKQDIENNNYDAAFLNKFSVQKADRRQQNLQGILDNKKENAPNFVNAFDTAYDNAFYAAYDATKARRIAHNMAFDDAFLGNFYFLRAQAQSLAYYYAFEGKHFGAQEQGHANGYDDAFIGTYDYVHSLAQGRGYYYAYIAAQSQAQALAHANAYDNAFIYAYTIFHENNKYTALH